MTVRGGGRGPLRLVAAGAALFGAGAAAAADPPAAPSVHEVVVPGHAAKGGREQALQSFVRRTPALNNGQSLARWVDPICPVVAGMTETQGEYVLVRLFQVARAAGARTLEGGHCAANVYIIATADPEGMAKAIGRRYPAMFAKAQAREIQDFQETTRPVRAWYNVHFDRPTTGAESPFEGLPIARNIPVIHHASDTRLSTNSPYALGSAIVVVDSRRLAGTKVGALADYIAMATLTQLKPGADGDGAPSILALFSPAPGEAVPDGLTAWDTAYLHALYHTSLEDLHQGAAIAFRMEEALGRGPAPSGH